MKSYHDSSDSELDIDDSFNDENSRISDVSDFFEHLISFETNGENSKHLFSFETNVENRSFFNDDSAIQPIKRDRERSRKQISKKNFIFTSDIYFFSNANKSALNHHPYVKSRKKNNRINRKKSIHTCQQKRDVRKYANFQLTFRK